MAEDSVGLLSSEEKQEYVERPHRSNVLHKVLHHLESALSQHNIFDTLKSFLLFLLPSFLASYLHKSSETHTSSSTKLRPTAYLDGLRGVAAWVVVNKHLIQLISTTAGIGFGHAGGNYEPYKLPIIRLIQEGDSAVCVFFVVSGFALSISPVIAMRKSTRDPAGFFRKVASSILRRPFRLYVPVWIAMSMVFVMIRVGYIPYFQNHEDQFRIHLFGWDKPSQEFPPFFDTFWAQSVDFFWHCTRQLDVFTDWTDHSWMTAYDSPSWTIPLEYRASLILYITHAALYLMEKRTRITIVCGLITLALFRRSLDFPLFWFGYLLAELSSTISSGSQDEAKTLNKLYKITWSVLGVAGLWFASFPGWGAEVTPGYVWMSRLSPWEEDLAQRWWGGVGAVLIVASLDRLEFARTVLNSRVVQYMGKISFSFYLMHVWVQHTVVLALFHYSFTLTSRTNLARSVVGFLLGYSAMWAIIIWVADIFHRSVDIWATALGFKVEKRLFVH